VDRSMIHLGLLHLEQAARGDKLSAYHLQAEIAATHSTTEHFTLTNWENILALYDLLREKQPTPVVLINRAVAVAQVKGPAAGLNALKAIPVDSQVERYPFLHARKANFIAGSGTRAKRRFLFTERWILRAPNRSNVFSCESWRRCAAIRHERPRCICLSYLLVSSGRNFDYCRCPNSEVRRGCSRMSALQNGNCCAGSGGALERHRVPEVWYETRDCVGVTHDFDNCRACRRRDCLAYFR